MCMRFFTDEEQAAEDKQRQNKGANKDVEMDVGEANSSGVEDDDDGTSKEEANDSPKSQSMSGDDSKEEGTDSNDSGEKSELCD
ncbi:unnamed protein product [Anisakis simplex]|uniref:Prothymosin alpha n=1 Tax=Anisakis simplex TaxID=6269 RepID=A0A0M3JHW4_ANISI|nr:unnamed protein product [Anisakis simplex]